MSICRRAMFRQAGTGVGLELEVRAKAGEVSAERNSDHVGESEDGNTYMLVQLFCAAAGITHPSIQGVIASVPELVAGGADVVVF